MVTKLSFLASFNWMLHSVSVVSCEAFEGEIQNRINGVVGDRPPNDANNSTVQIVVSKLLKRGHVGIELIIFNVIIISPLFMSPIGSNLHSPG